jgi:predicted permease
MAAVCLLLAIACANVALLMLARSRGRDRELLVRVAVGASRYRIARLVFAESLIVAALGGAAGIVVARVALMAVDLRALSTVPRLESVSIDFLVLAFAIGTSTLAAVAFGLAPALRAARVDVADGLRGAAIGSVSRRGSRFRESMIVTQLALGLVLVVGAGLVVQSFRALADTDSGFEPAGALTMRVATPGRGLQDRPAIVAFHEELMERLRRLPGVTAAGATSQVPLTGQGPLQPFAYDAETARNWEQISADGFNVSPGYFKAAGATLIAGRDFSNDDIKHARRVIIIDDTLAQRAYGGTDKAVGRQLQLEPEGTPESFFEVIGVIRHMKYHDLRRAVLPQIFRGGLFLNFNVVLRSDGDASNLAEPARLAIAGLRPGSAVQRVRLLSEIVEDALGPMRLAVWLMIGFGIVALTLAAVGIYGVFAYFVAERTREIAVRLALGATPADVRRLVVGRAVTLLAIGLGTGLFVTIGLGPATSGLLYSVSAYDAGIYLAAVLCLAAIALAACWLPAYRASRLDPQAGLRQA